LELGSLLIWLPRRHIIQTGSNVVRDFSLEAVGARILHGRGTSSIAIGVTANLNWTGINILIVSIVGAGYD
jgi:hypothetical protein